MKRIQAYFLYTVLIIGVIVFAWFYIRGPQGIQKLQSMYQEHATMQDGIDQLNTEVAELKREIDSWNTHSFHKEKIAREQLQMARPDDEVFYLT